MHLEYRATKETRITTFHPADHNLREIVKGNWDMLGKSPTTSFIHKKELVCGYRRPKNLRDLLVRAAIPYRQGDELANPSFVPQEEPIPPPEVPAAGPNTRLRQQSMTDFLTTVQSNTPLNPTHTTLGSTNPLPPQTRGRGSLNKERGFPFCNRNENSCRYCNKLNKTGNITCSATGVTYQAMKNVSCRSSNLIYGVTCTRCGKQYVGQTLLRLKDRFGKHFYDVEKGDKLKAVGLHFSQHGHNGIQDIQITWNLSRSLREVQKLQLSGTE